MLYYIQKTEFNPFVERALPALVFALILPFIPETMHNVLIELYKSNPIPTAATNTLPPTHFSIFPAIPVNTDSVAVAVVLPVNVALLPPPIFVALSEATGGVVGVV